MGCVSGPKQTLERWIVVIIHSALTLPILIFLLDLPSIDDCVLISSLYSDCFLCNVLV